MSGTVSIAGLDKALVLKALYHGSSPQGLGFIEDARVSLGDCERAVDAGYVDYLAGRPIKADLSGEEFDPRLYDRDAGQGAAQRAVAALVAA